MASAVIDQNSEGGFVFESVLEFLQCWDLGTDSRLILETHHGRAWMNFSCCMGRPYGSPKRLKSKDREQKDNVRAAFYQARTPEKVQTVDKTVGENVEAFDVDDSKDESVTIVTRTEIDIDKEYKLSEDQNDSILDVLEQGIEDYVKDNYKHVKIQKVEPTGVTRAKQHGCKRMIEYEFNVSFQQQKGSEDFKNIVEKLCNDKAKMRMRGSIGPHGCDNNSSCRECALDKKDKDAARKAGKHTYGLWCPGSQFWCLVKP